MYMLTIPNKQRAPVKDLVCGLEELDASIVGTLFGANVVELSIDVIICSTVNIRHIRQTYVV